MNTDKYAPVHQKICEAQSNIEAAEALLDQTRSSHDEAFLTSRAFWVEGYANSATMLSDMVNLGFPLRGIVFLHKREDTAEAEEGNRNAVHLLDDLQSQRMVHGTGLFSGQTLGQVLSMRSSRAWKRKYDRLSGMLLLVGHCVSRYLWGSPPQEWICYPQT